MTATRQLPRNNTAYPKHLVGLALHGHQRVVNLPLMGFQQRQLHVERLLAQGHLPQRLLQVQQRVSVSKHLAVPVGQTLTLLDKQAGS